jgi:hypothetical protein
MTDTRSKATDQVREHVNRVQDTLSEYRRDGINANGILTRPLFRAASLKAAREELSRAIAIIERTRW